MALMLGRISLPTLVFRSLLVGGLIICSSSTYASFYGEHAKGWFWYAPYASPYAKASGDKHEDKPVPRPVPRSLGEGGSLGVGGATQALETYKKDLENKKNLALMYPTVANVTNYMQVQKEMMAKAEHFSSIWQKVVLTNPELNYERVYPTAQYARHAQDDLQRQQMETRIRAMARTHGLFYFSKRDCGHCQAFAPIVQAFAKKYGWDVMPISLDEEANLQADTRVFASSLGIKAVPALVAFNTTTQAVIPIAYAAVSLDQLEENLMTLTGTDDLPTLPPTLKLPPSPRLRGTGRATSKLREAKE
jgi:conjugal transfer pilus assembly protein TraF